MLNREILKIVRGIGIEVGYCFGFMLLLFGINTILL